MRAKKRAKNMTYGEKVLEEIEKDIDNDVRMADQLEREGSIGYQNAVLDEMEKKHHSEREVVFQWILRCELIFWRLLLSNSILLT